MHPKILLVDDDDASRYVLKTMLAEKQFQIVEATRGFEGIRQAIAIRPSVIVLDLGLPDLDGSSVLKELKQNADTLAIPIIINTSRDLPTQEKNALNAMAVGILSKNDTDPEAAKQTLFSLLTAAGALE